MQAAAAAEIEKIRQESVLALENQKAAAAVQQNAAREEGKKAAAEAARLTIDAMAAERDTAKNAVIETERQKLAAAAELQAVKAQRDAEITARVAEARSAVEKNKTDEINAINAKHALDTAQVADRMSELQRRLDAVEGEGADVKLYDALKAKYPKDDIVRVDKTFGADIIHTVKHNKKACGTIVYDSRNRNLWQDKFASQLRDDMVTENADHAILATNKFPKNVRHVHYCEGIIAANPARVLVLSEILRAEIVRSHAQRVSGEDRDQKTQKLYDFIVSDGFEKLFGSAVANDEKLLQLEVEEKKAHDAMWQKRGRLLTSSQKLHAKIGEQIEAIIGTGEAE